MADLSRSVVLRILGLNEDAKRKIDEINKSGDKLDRRKVSFRIGADAAGADTVVRKTNLELDRLNRRIVTPTIRADDKPGVATIDDYRRKLVEASKMSATAKLKADDREGTITIRDFTRKMNEASKIIATSKLHADGRQGKAEIADVEKKLAAFNKIRANAKVGINGYSRSITEVRELELALDKLKRKEDEIKLGESLTGLAKAGVEAGTPDRKGGLLGGLLDRLFSGGGDGGGGGGGGLRTLESAGGSGAGGLSGIAGSGGIGVIGSLNAETIGGIAAAIASLLPGVMGGALGIGVPGTLVGGQLLLAKQAQQTLKADATAVTQAKTPQAEKAAQAQLNADSKTGVPLINELDTLKGIAVPFLKVFTELAGPVSKIFAEWGRAIAPLAPMLATMFRASLPLLKTFLGFMTQAGKVLLPAFTYALKQMGPAFPEFLQGILALLKGLAMMFRVMGPGMKASSGVFLYLMRGIAAILVFVGFAGKTFAILFELVWKGVATSVRIAWDVIKIVGALLTGNWRSLGNAAKDLWRTIVGWFKAIATGVMELIRPFGGAMVKVLKGSWDIIKNAALFLWHALVDYWTGFGHIVRMAWDGLWAGIKIVAKAVWDFLKAAAVGFWHVLVHVWDSMAHDVKVVWEALWGGVRIVAKAVWDFLRGAAEAFWHVIVHIWNSLSHDVRDAWNFLWNNVKTVAKDVWNFIKNAATDFWHAIVHVWNSISHDVRDVWNFLWNGVVHVAKDTWNFLKSAATDFWHAIVHVFNVISHDVRDAWSFLWDTAKNVGKNAWDWIKNHVIGFWHDIVHIFNVISHDVRTAWDFIWSHLEGGARTAIGILENIINSIKRAFEIPIAFVVNHVWDPLANLWNSVVGKVGLGSLKLPAPKNFHFAEGGVVPGHPSMGDNVPIYATPGERVLSLNQVSMLGGHSAIDSMVGIGTGGPIRAGGHYAGGGGGAGSGGGKNSGGQGNIGSKRIPLGKEGASLGNPITMILHDVGGFLSKIANWTLGKIEGFVFGPILDLLGKVPGGGVVKTLLQKMLKALIDALTGQLQGAAQAAQGGLPGYANPLRKVRGLTPERIDMGVDYAGSGPIFAIGPGTIVNTSGAGWPGKSFIDERLSDPPFAGKFWYAAENIVPKVHVGQKVNSNTIIGDLINASPNMETGWASGRGTSTMAAELHQQAGGDPGGHTSAMGWAANQLLTALGAPSGIKQGKIFGKIPKGFQVPQGVAANFKAGSMMADGRDIFTYLMGTLFRGHPIAAAGAVASMWGESMWNPESKNCVPLTYKVVTTRGILSHDEVEVGDVTLVFSPETGEIEEAVILDIPYHDNALICRIGNDNWSVVCTPYHKWLTSDGELVRVDKMKIGATQVMLGDGRLEWVDYVEDLGRQDTFCLTTTTGTWTAYRDEDTALAEGHEAESGEFWTGNTGGWGLMGWTGNFPDRRTGNATRDMNMELPLIVKYVHEFGDMGAIREMMGARTVAQAANIWGPKVEKFGINDVHSEGIRLATQIMNSGGSNKAVRSTAAKIVSSLANIKFAGGGIIPEEVFGIGLRSGQTYSFAEKGPELVVPNHMLGYGSGGGGDTYIITVAGDTDPDAAAVRIWKKLRKMKTHKGLQTLGL